MLSSNAKSNTFACILWGFFVVVVVVVVLFVCLFLFLFFGVFFIRWKISNANMFCGVIMVSSLYVYVCV